MQRKSFHLSDEIVGRVESISNNMEITESEVYRILIKQGLNNWEMKLRMAMIESKVDIMLENFAVEDDAKERMMEVFEDVELGELNDDIFIGERNDLPDDSFKPYGITPESWEDNE